MPQILCTLLWHLITFVSCGKTNTFEGETSFLNFTLPTTDMKILLNLTNYQKLCQHLEYVFCAILNRLENYPQHV